ncbi:MAG TPA: hypothetical protein VGR06_15815 [Actinophytocola sp.]|uniref:hypothetical protein n=1 Tax=Actinophytocola sp. TaxID=1872138 RepID=UPI002E00DE12|nr:hypothetical protein [Actinophytocola sp.]
MRARIFYSSTEPSQADVISGELRRLGVSTELVDLRFVSTITEQCDAIIGDGINVVDTSIDDVTASALVGFALGTGMPLLVLKDGRESLTIGPEAVNLLVTERIRIEADLAQLMERLAHNQSLTHDRVGLFAPVDPAEPVAIVCAEIPRELRPAYAQPEHRDFLRYSTFADIDALILLMVWFSASKHRAVQAYTSTDLPENVFLSHIMVVGGPSWNKLARSLYQQICLPIDHLDGGPGKPDPIATRSGEDRWLPEFRDDEVASDVGFVAQVTSPFQPDRTVTIFGGILTHGVEAAVKAFTSPQVRTSNWELVKPLIAPPSRGFCVVFRARVVLNTNVPPDFRHPGVLLAAFACVEGAFVRVQTP